MKKWERIRRAASIIRAVGVLALTGVTAPYVWIFHASSISGEPHDWEAFGAYVGGAAGTVIGLATLYVLASTWSEQAREVEESRYTTHRQIFDSTFFKMLEQFAEIFPTLHFIGRGDLTGRQAIQNMYVSMPFSGGDDERSAIETMYGEMYLRQESELGPYFRTLYHVFKFIDRDTVLTDEDKVEYANIARARLSNYELLLIFYNCLTERGAGFKPLVERYGVLKHLNRLDLKAPHHKEDPQLYLPTAFMNADERAVYNREHGVH